MAKKGIRVSPRRSNKKKKKGKNRNQTPSFFTSLKQMFLWAFIVAVCFIGLLFLYNHFSPDKIPSETQVVEIQETKPVSKTTSPKEKDTPSATKTQKNPILSFPENAEVPRLRCKRQEQVIWHEGYTVSYNSDYKIANWVAWELTAQEAKSKKVERANKFVPNPYVKGASAMNEDYTRTGFDRGHLAPAGDMKWSAKAMRESFYLSNICPQDPGLNRGAWNDLEILCRLWAVENGTLLIVAGPVIEKDMRRMGKNRVGVPSAFYKVIGTITNNQYKGIGFLFENKDCKNISLQAKAIPIDSVERVTGIEFFHRLSGEDQRKMKATVDWSYWSF